MNKKAQARRVVAFGWAVAAVSVLSSLLVVVKEINPATKALMKAATGHHWVTHSIAVIAVFLLIGIVLTRVDANSVDNAALNKLAFALVAATAIGGLILVGFYLLH